jgi:hypothetical protein
MCLLFKNRMEVSIKLQNSAIVQIRQYVFEGTEENEKIIFSGFLGH